ncbi:site-specific integrase [Clostridium botulinum]|uniref:site-specific integrase n=1 Tax=Clostridium botulinum TaxID=1491 RepID=UPI003A7FB87B
MQSNTTCPLIEQYLGYLVVIKGRSDNTVKEYRTDLLIFFSYIINLRHITIIDENFAQVDLDIRSLQQIPGDESVATTEIYTHIDEHQLQSAVNSNSLAMMFR